MAYYVIQPIVTEKMTRITEKEGKYGFICKPEANKLQIKAEIESRYTRSGLIKGRTNRFNKAIVTLKEGETIDFYSNI